MTVTELRHRLALIDAELHRENVRLAYLAYLEHRRAELTHQIAMEIEAP